ncbi:MBL fold metallo-hydrolase [Rhizobacter sp. SG703]|uniref:MBL fold metallo-hydrolase n=1 Tax=Rhizobacter sp. SG703 TaxID=2587140 RepID=UPI0017B00173|nr:MBL fold metallo-hydrolase [Rhizobacter sp. SG703]NKI94569.1 N-acyl-phosphatidylethanolamine-hydrolysing phospholipase D [Rhizobacter sp. SG703]
MTFRNNYAGFEPKSLADVLRWRWAAHRNGVPRPPRGPIPQVAPDLAFLQANARAGAAMQPAVTWIGHATVLAQLGGLTLLTDPVFSERASPVPFAGPKRHQPPGVALADLPHIDLVLASHNHYDHLDGASVDALQRQPGGAPLFIVPLGVKAWLAERGIANAVELDWWTSHTVPSPTGPVEVTLVPAQHWSGRGLADRMKTLWGGFAVFAPDCHLFYAGDTAYSRDFIDIQAHFAERQSAANGGGFDVALLPIGAYEPRWFMAPQHVDVEEAIRIHRDLRAKRSLGVHWGTFQLSDEALDDPPHALAEQRRSQALSDEEFFVLAIGETRQFPPRRPAAGGLG